LSKPDQTLSTTDYPRRIKERLRILGRPTTEKDLIKQLRVKGEARLEAKRAIEGLLTKGELVRTRTDRIGLPEKMDLVAGRLEMKRGGFGFVVPSEPGLADVYVPSTELAGALHGDRVLDGDVPRPLFGPEVRLDHVVLGACLLNPISRTAHPISWFF